MRRYLPVKYLKVVALSGAAAVVQLGQADDLKRNAEDVYQAFCHYCHESGPGPDLKARQLPASYVSYVVRHGQRAMPAFRPTEISDAELEIVAAAIERSTGGGQ
jgi:mono/diheme cytochrome c family protein